jgi:hypothetical protein
MMANIRPGKKLRAAAFAGPFGLAALMLLMLAGPALAYSTFDNVTNDWAPCSGYNHWNLDSTDLSQGTFAGYDYDQSNQYSLCGTDTTEHEVNAGVYASTTFSPTTTGTLKLTATFSGSAGVSAYESNCGNGYGHAWFEYGVGAKDTTTGSSFSHLVVLTAIIVNCGTNQAYGSAGSVSYSWTFTAGQTYDAFWVIDAQDGSLQNNSAGTAQAAVDFEGTCGQNGVCGGPVGASSITVS